MSPPLCIPPETIERILFFAFDRDGPPVTPFTLANAAVTPPAGTSHLKLISSDIADGSLPLYWRSVTLLRADDWVKLWNPKTGLFVGERGKERASWVREIRLNTAATGQLPIDLRRVERSYAKGIKPKEVLIRLTAVNLPRLKHVCFFEHGRDPAEPAQEDYEVEAEERAAGRVIAGDEDLKDTVGGYELEEKERERERYLSTLPDEEREEEEERDRERAEADGDYEWYDDHSDALVEERRKAFHALVLNAAPDLESVRMFIASEVAQALVVPLDLRLTHTFRLPISLYLKPHSDHHHILSGIRCDARYDFIGVPSAQRSEIAKETFRYRSKRPTPGFWRWANEDGTFSPFDEFAAEHV